jgi:hypothetical protein
VSQASQSYCLFLEPELDSDLPTRSDSQGLRYIELSGCECLGHRAGKLTRPQQGDHHSIRLEPIRSKTRNSLLLTFEPGARVTVNGLAAAWMTVLNPGDVLEIDEHTLFVTLLSRPYTGPPDENHLAARCGYCRAPIHDEAGMRVYVCPNCHLPTHDHGEEIPVEKRLECVKLSSHCGHCQAVIVKSEGFTHVPTF